MMAALPGFLAAAIISRRLASVQTVAATTHEFPVFIAISRARRDAQTMTPGQVALQKPHFCTSLRSQSDFGVRPFTA